MSVLSSHGIDLAFHLAAFVGLWHLAVAGYLVYIAEAHDIPLLTIALAKAVLGGSVYLLVRQPQWVIAFDLLDWLLPLALLSMVGISVALTRLIWSHWELEAPQDRIRELLTRACND